MTKKFAVNSNLFKFRNSSDIVTIFRCRKIIPPDILFFKQVVLMHVNNGQHLDYDKSLLVQHTLLDD